MVLGTSPQADIDLREIGSNGSAPTVKADVGSQIAHEDPRDDYQYIVESDAIIAAAAKIVGIEPDEFGEAEITVGDDQALMEFEVDGETPEQAQQKSMALYKVLHAKIDQLRQEEFDRQKAELKTNLGHDEKILNESQRAIIGFKSRSPYHADEQISQLSTSIEEMRASQAGKVAEIRGLQAKLSQISSHKPVTASQVFDAYLLQSDSAYKNQFEKYGEAFAEFATLDTAVGENHPDLVAKKAEMKSILEEMSERAAFLLGRTVDEKELIKLNSLAVDPRMIEWANDNSALHSLEATVAEMENQIAILEQRLILLDQEKIAFSQVQVDFLGAQSSLNSTIAKLGLDREAIDAIYPPIQLAVEPNLPDEASMPDPQIAALVGGAATFMLAAFLVFLVWERNSPWRNPSAWIP
jgi:uncharacterized protein involved in exopolysaccharide biosynthesis